MDCVLTPNSLTTHNMCMDRIHLEIDSNHHRELKKLAGNVTEHVRQAIKEYLERKFSVSTSPTKEVIDNE